MAKSFDDMIWHSEPWCEVHFRTKSRRNPRGTRATSGNVLDIYPDSNCRVGGEIFKKTTSSTEILEDIRCFFVMWIRLLASSDTSPTLVAGVAGRVVGSVNPQDIFLKK